MLIGNVVEYQAKVELVQTSKEAVVSKWINELKDFWSGNKWWSALIWFLVAGFASFIWLWVYSMSNNPLHLIILLIFSLASLYYLVKFLILIFRSRRES